MNGDNININWTLQIILFLFIFVGGLILGNLITGLAVNRIEQLFEKAEMYFNVKASILKLILNIVQLEKYFILHNSWGRHSIYQSGGYLAPKAFC